MRHFLQHLLIPAGSVLTQDRFHYNAGAQAHQQGEIPEIIFIFTNAHNCFSYNQQFCTTGFLLSFPECARLGFIHHPVRDIVWTVITPLIRFHLMRLLKVAFHNPAIYSGSFTYTQEFFSVELDVQC